MPNEFRSPNNRRRYARTNIFVRAHYTCPIRNAPVEVQTRISDISEGGVSLITSPDQLPLNTIIMMSFVIPGSNGGLVTVGGKVKDTKVIGQNTYRSGIEFIGMDKKHLLAIREYVASHPPR